MEIDFHRAQKSSSVLRKKKTNIARWINRFGLSRENLTFITWRGIRFLHKKVTTQFAVQLYRIFHFWMKKIFQLSTRSLSKVFQTPSRVPSRENRGHCFPNEATRDYEGERSWASLLRLSVGDGVALLDGDGDGATGVEDLGTVAVW